MPFDHLRYCLEEIDAAYQFIQLDNADFYKRGIARMIAMRTHDFLAIASQVNNASIRSTRIRGDLNALRELYNGFLELQRHKFGAHFQDLDLGTRIEAWSLIDLNRVGFFYTNAMDIYGKFVTHPDYRPLTPLALDPRDEQNIRESNNRLDIEKYPNMSADILSLTRPNGFHVVHSSALQNKAGAVKSIELLIEYEFQTIKQVTYSLAVKDMLAKLFVTDLLSYIDNLFTRTDVLPGAPQYEKGLDDYITNVNFPEPFKILDEFKKNFRLPELAAELRTIRNKCGGHIDTGQTIDQLKQMARTINMQKCLNVFNQLKRAFKSLCYADIRLHPFVMEPLDRLYGIELLSGLTTRSFDGVADLPAHNPLPAIDNEATYEEKWKSWIVNLDQESLDYFFRCFGNAPLLEKKSWEIDHGIGSKSYTYFDYRLIHRFFERKLGDADASILEKNKIVDLFIKSRSGFPQQLASILIKLYPSAGQLQGSFLIALGYLLSHRSQQFFVWVKEKYETGDFYEQYRAIRSLFKVDLTSRHNIRGGDHRGEESEFSQYLKEILSEVNDVWRAAAFSLVLSSIYYFDNLTRHPRIEALYLPFFHSLFKNASENLVHRFDPTNEAIAKLVELNSGIEKHRYCTVSVVLGDFFSAHQEKVLARNSWLLVHEHLISIPFDDDQEAQNYASASFSLEDYDLAIAIIRNLRKKHPGRYDYEWLLLNMYLSDKKYRADFTRERQQLLDLFSLTDQQKQDLNSLAYES